MEHALIVLLIWVVVIAAVAFVACWVIERTLPGDVQMPLKVLVGVLALVAILLKLMAVV